MKKWDILKSSVAYQNKYFSVVAEEFRLQGGEIWEYFLLKSADFVAIIAVEDDHIYLGKVDRYALRKRIIEIPMGGIEPGETPLAAAKRELKEEMGIRAKRYRKIGQLDASKGRSDQRGIVFVAEGLTRGEQELDPVEKEGNLEVIKVKLDEVPELIRRGKITDSHTLACLSLFMLDYKGLQEDKS